MTLRTAAYIAGGSYSADDDRNVLEALVPSEGVLGVNDFAVTVDSPASMKMRVGAGDLFLKVDSASGAGMYHTFEDSSTLVPFASPNALARVDLLVVRVRDKVFGGANNDTIYQAIPGTPGSALPPVAPMPDVDGAGGAVFSLWSVPIPASGAGSTITAAGTDLRTLCRAFDGTIVASTFGGLGSGSRVGLKGYTLDTKVEYTWDGAAWVPSAALGPWTNYTPAWSVSGAGTQPIIGGGGSLRGRYQLLGKTCRFSIRLDTAAGSNLGEGPWQFSVPFTASASAVDTLVNVWLDLTGDGSTRYTGTGIITAGSNLVTRIAGWGTGSWSHTVPTSVLAGATIVLSGQYEVA